MLLLYGKEDPRIYDPYYLEKGYIFNFTTMKEGYESLQILVPPNVLGHLEGLEFDTAYISINAVGKCNINEWNGNRTPQLFVEDYDVVGSGKYLF